MPLIHLQSPKHLKTIIIKITHNDQRLTAAANQLIPHPKLIADLSDQQTLRLLAVQHKINELPERSHFLTDQPDLHPDLLAELTHLKPGQNGRRHPAKIDRIPAFRIAREIALTLKLNHEGGDPGAAAEDTGFGTEGSGCLGGVGGE
jgi:hypothetical protein